jgi:carboxypeptidase Taq
VSAAGDLRAALGEVSDLGTATGLMHWDERTKMPAGGAPARAEHLATLARITHDRLVSDELGRLLDAARAELDGGDPDSDDASVVRVASREWEKARRVPSDLHAEMARAESIAEHSWVAAREANDFSAFRPHLEGLVEQKRRYIDCFDVDHPYDALLDDFEPEASTPAVAATLEQLRAGLTPLVERVAAAGDIDSGCLRGDFAVDRQRLFANELAGSMPFEPGSWRLDDTTHPFATSMSPADVRLTTRYDPSYLGTAIWSVIHEAGHGLYEAGMPESLARTPAAGPRSLGLHESQSRLWENWVGRGRPYMGPLLARLREHFRESFDDVEADELYRAANVVRRSLIRVEADELTYNLHIAIRFELELELFDGDLTVADLPEAWNARYRDYLGLDVPDDAVGVLQDVHWAGGAFGYFPTYSLGNVIAAQLWDRANADLPDLDAQLGAGELEPLHGWLRATLFRYAGKHSAAATLKRAIGEDIDPAPLLAQLEAKYGQLYDV